MNRMPIIGCLVAVSAIAALGGKAIAEIENYPQNSLYFASKTQNLGVKL